MNELYIITTNIRFVSMDLMREDKNARISKENE